LTTKINISLQILLL